MGSGSPTLLLVPTELEARRLVPALPRGRALRACIGFGPIAAAARTAELLARLRPARVVLAGIAGTYDERALPLASAAVFERVALDGVGAGEGAGHLGPRELGLAQWRAAEGAAIEDELALLAPAGVARAGELLTVCAASASPAEVAVRRARRPAAVAEDMEAFAVALACALATVPLVVVRGVSNRAGERERARWDVPGALAAAARLLEEVL